MEASATTAVTATRSISHFSVNSPFFFALVDESSMVPLFMGVVTNPASDHDGRMSNDEPEGNSTMSNDSLMEPNQQDAELCSNKKALKDEDGGSNTTSSSNRTSTNSSYSINNTNRSNNNTFSSSNSTSTNGSYSINNTSSSNNSSKSGRISAGEAQVLLLKPELKN